MNRKVVTSQQSGLADRPWEALPDEAVDALIPLLPQVADEIIQAIASEVPAYARPLEGSFGEGVRLGVEQALEQFVEMARNPGTGRSEGRGVYVALGRGEVREGRPLEALLAAYRVGARVAWRRLATAGLEAGVSPEALTVFAESIFAYIDELSAESAEGYAQEQAAQAGERDRRREELIALLVQGPAPDPAAAAAAAEAAQWPLPDELAAVVWDAAGSRRPAARLPVGSIVATLERCRCALVPDPDGPGRARETLSALEGVTAGVGPSVAWQAAAESYRRASAALRLGEERGEEGPVVAAEHRAELVLRAEPSLVAELAEERLAPLAAETLASRERLETTLLAWLRRHGNVGGAAADLHVHPQTVRYRLGRLRELLGDALDDPDARFELELALRGRPSSDYAASGAGRTRA